MRTMFRDLLALGKVQRLWAEEICARLFFNCRPPLLAVLFLHV